MAGRLTQALSSVLGCAAVAGATLACAHAPAQASAPSASAAPAQAAPATALSPIALPGPLALSSTQQLALREAWLRQRHALVLAMMRRHGIAMWIVVNEEFHDDPLTALVAPPRPMAGNRDLFIFADEGSERGLHKYALTGYAEESVLRFFEVKPEGLKVAEALQALYARVKPATIALSIEPPGAAPSRGVARSLTRASYQFLAEALGPEGEKRFVPAAPLLEEYLDTRLPDERPYYAAMVALTDELARRALSAEVIAKGRTTIGDVRRWLYDQLGARGLTTWFEPDLRLQRRGLAMGTSRGFPAVAREDVIIQPGDLLHLDFGLTCLGLNTDWQKMAYVLRPGEDGVPAALTAALANTNALQDAVTGQSRPGRISADVYEAAMAAMKKRSADLQARGLAPFEAQIYSHPLGNQGHGLGAAIDFRAASRKEPPKALRAGSYIAIELNTRTKVAEWDGQEVFAMEEDPAELTDAGFRFFQPRQTAFYLVR